MKIHNPNYSLGSQRVKLGLFETEVLQRDQKVQFDAFRAETVGYYDKRFGNTALSFLKEARLWNLANPFIPIQRTHYD